MNVNLPKAVSEVLLRKWKRKDTVIVPADSVFILPCSRCDDAEPTEADSYQGEYCTMISWQETRDTYKIYLNTGECELVIAKFGDTVSLARNSIQTIRAGEDKFVERWLSGCRHGLNYDYHEDEAIALQNHPEFPFYQGLLTMEELLDLPVQYAAYVAEVPPADGKAGEVELVGRFYGSVLNLLGKMFR